jgi:hypothetical protein
MSRNAQITDLDEAPLVVDSLEKFGLEQKKTNAFLFGARIVKNVRRFKY